MSDRTMYDAVTWENIPRDAQMVAGYVDGLYAWPAAAWERFKHAARVHISVIPPGDHRAAGVLDVETGGASVSDAPGFIKARDRAGERAVIYCNRSTLPAVQAACAGLNHGLWIATLDGTRKLPDMKNVVAVQYAGGPTAPYDTSIVYDSSWHRR